MREWMTGYGEFHSITCLLHIGFLNGKKEKYFLGLNS